LLPQLLPQRVLVARELPQLFGTSASAVAFAVAFAVASVGAKPCLSPPHTPQGLPTLPYIQYCQPPPHTPLLPYITLHTMKHCAAKPKPKSKHHASQSVNPNLHPPYALRKRKAYILNGTRKPLTDRQANKAKLMRRCARVKRSARLQAKLDREKAQRIATRVEELRAEERIPGAIPKKALPFEPLVGVTQLEQDPVAYTPTVTVSADMYRFFVEQLQSC